MLEFPKASEVNKKVPKESVYRNAEANARLKSLFVEQIEQIWWTNKLTSETINVAPGEKTTEIDVFEIRRRKPYLDLDILRAFDKSIPRAALFLLEFEGKYCAAISYKEVVERGENVDVKISEFYMTEPLERRDLPCKIEGLTLDSVYENFVRQIAGDKLRRGKNSSLKEDFLLARECEKIKKKIETIEKQARKEVQFRKQVEIRAQIKPLLQRLREIEEE